MKKVLTYFLVIAIVLGIVGAVVYFLTRGNNQAGDQTGQTGTLPSAFQGGTGSGQGGLLSGGSLLDAGSSSTTSKSLTIVTNEPVLNYFINNDNGTTAIRPDGTIVAITNNNIDVISSSQIKNIISATFSYDGMKVLVNFGERQNSQTSVFDTKTKSWTPLPVGMISPQWSPSDYKIIYLQNNSNGTKTLATIDTSKAKNNINAITTLHLQDVSLSWRSKSDVLFYDNPSIYTRGSAWSFNLQKKSLSPIINEQRGMESLWSSATTTKGILFIGDASQYGGSLQFVNESGNTIERLGFLTLPSKCLFSEYNDGNIPPSSITTPIGSTNSSQTINALTTSSSYLALYCGIPRDQNTFSSGRLPDDYENLSLFTSDNIYRINTSNGNVTALFDDKDQNMDVSSIKIFKDSLFFINRYDQKLYSVKQ